MKTLREMDLDDEFRERDRHLQENRAEARVAELEKKARFARTRELEAKVRVAELETLGKHAVRRDIYDASQDRVAELKAEVTRLCEVASAADKQPRPMSEAPKDGSKFAALMPLRYINRELGGNVHDDHFIDLDGDVWGPDFSADHELIGWLPMIEEEKPK
jgi:hypothetical protein